MNVSAPFIVRPIATTLLMIGVTVSVLPNSLSWNPLNTAWAVCSLKFNCGTGWARVILISAF